MGDQESQEDELTALASIYDSSVFSVSQDGDDRGGQFSACLALPQPFVVSFLPAGISEDSGSEGLKADGKNICAVHYLPPIILNFVIPADYPSRQSPQFTLSCKWLTKCQLTKLCQRLDELWKENKGSVILFLWTDFLQNDTFSFLHLTSPLDLSNVLLRHPHQKSSEEICDSHEPNKTHDERAIQDIAAQRLLRPTILDFDTQEQQREFERTVFTCNVCFMEKPGSQCIQFATCDHVYCKKCMTDYFIVQIQDGNVGSLTCPDHECDSQALPSQVKDLVSVKLFTRYDDLLLKTSLDLMKDVTYCPRPICQVPVIFDHDSSIASCSACHYVFCVHCKLVYHGLSPCKIKADELSKLREEYQNASPEEKLFLEKRYGKRTIQQAVEESFTNEWLNQFSKQCPSCGAHIQKIDGCNKMTCTKCRNYFCWICEKSLSRTNPYKHFSELNNDCFNRLFEGIDQNMEFDDWEEGDEDDDDDFL
ncbi:E3 ubiquitin-protein ligase RNF14-like [Gigantopelta aegis]|uniref:E3 ubiquitin-protein ligase RNF14-like n=1 Tax=Gigantopelta aegis TaxID=1735272 RepID=UPI001B88951C|nr:E3 ubiquitin-protein ligase RNF14-like [Gigantopelta aegis]XP_041375613.1 E3 ubiquitin-protein ligase RNF14-like [Gigantopelta aegis]